MRAIEKSVLQFGTRIGQQTEWTCSGPWSVEGRKRFGRLSLGRDAAMLLERSVRVADSGLSGVPTAAAERRECPDGS